jgi:hypothetical protein
MIRYKWPVATAIPQNPEVRRDIVKAMQKLAADGDEPLWQRRAEIAFIKQGLAELAQDAVALRSRAPALILSELGKYGYNPEEPRVPKHNTGGGQWTRVAGNDDQNAASDIPRFQENAEGHHWVPDAVLKKFKFKQETRKVLENASSGALADPTVNFFHREHRQYNDAVERYIRKFLTENNIAEGELTPEQAETLYRRVRGSNDPVIGGLNRKVLRERLRYIEYFYLRGGGDEE